MSFLIKSLAAVLLLVATFALPAHAAEDVSFDEITRMLEAKAVTLIDVREADEFAAGHVPGAVNMPLSQLNPAMVPASTPDKPVVVMCRSGNRSGKAQAALAQAGRTDIRNFKGSMIEWTARGAPIAK